MGTDLCAVASVDLLLLIIIHDGLGIGVELVDNCITHHRVEACLKGGRWVYFMAGKIGVGLGAIPCDGARPVGLLFISIWGFIIHEHMSVIVVVNKAAREDIAFTHAIRLIFVDFQH